LLPMGEYKGSGLALMLGLLAGTLNGAAFGRDVVDFNADAASETNTGHFIVALDVARFVPLARRRAARARAARSARPAGAGAAARAAARAIDGQLVSRAVATACANSAF